MDRHAPPLRLGLFLVLGLLASACGQSTQIVRAPFISPIVVPAPDVFQMNVAVKNYGTTPSEALWLRVYSEYWPTATPPPGQPPCSYEDFLEVGVLAPDASEGFSDYRIDRAGDCPCVKDACTGHVWLSLHLYPLNGPSIEGQDTALHVNWIPSGALAGLTVEPF